MENEGGSMRNTDPAGGRDAVCGDSVKIERRVRDDQVGLEWIGGDKE